MGEGPDKHAIKLARSKALAEFELTQEPRVLFGQIALNLSEVRDIFDLLKEEKYAQWYWEINVNTDLEVFLAKRGKVIHPPENFGPLENPAYRDFTEEWIPPAMKVFFMEAIIRNDALSCRSIFAALNHYSNSDQREILIPVMEFMNSVIRSVTMVGTGYYKGAKDLEVLMESIEPFVVQFFNFLPAYYSSEKELYAKNLLGLTENWAKDHRNAKYLLPAIHETIFGLQISEAIKKPSVDYFKMTLGNEGHFRKQILQRKKSSSSLPKWFSTTVGCVIILFVLFLLYAAFHLGFSLIFSGDDTPPKPASETEVVDAPPSQNPTAQPLFPKKPSPEQ